MTLQSYRDLIVWQKSIQLCLDVYRVCQKFPKHELYGLVSQMCRCAVSIPSNIAEGYVRRSRNEYIQFISIAFASGAELETQLFIAHSLGYVSKENFNAVNDKLDEVMRMLNGLRSKLKSNP